MNKPAIELQKLCKSHPGSEPTLKDVSAKFASGQISVILGPSGAGKSTLLNCLLLAEKADSGSIFIKGLPVKGEQHDPRVICGVLQSPSLFAHLTVLENMTLAPKLVLKKTREAAEREALELLKQLGLETKANQYPHQLSGGEAQRTGIARALMMGPEILVLDEPTNALNEHWILILVGLLKELVRNGTTVIVSTHHLSFARLIADQVVILDESGCLQPVEDLKALPQSILDSKAPRRRKSDQMSENLAIGGLP